MSYMFMNATAFNQSIGDWDVSKVTNMESMFQDAVSFNADLGRWKVSKVTNMYAMFSHARSFNQSSLANWDVSSVGEIDDMLMGAKCFHADLRHRQVSNTTTASRMFKGISCDQCDYTPHNLQQRVSAPTFSHKCHYYCTDPLSYCECNWCPPKATASDHGDDDDDEMVAAGAATMQTAVSASKKPATTF